MFIYFQGDHINLSLYKLDDKGEQQSVIFWTTMVKKEQNEYSFKQFIDMFVHPVMNLLSGNTEIKISEEIQKKFHLTQQTQTGDWYLYENYTEIRVFGCELPPFKLPKYLPMRIFSLEYIRQMINMEQIHFTSAKKKSQFRIKTQVGQFIFNSMEAREEAEKILKTRKFDLSFTWSYDPLGIISKLRVDTKYTLYFHTTRLEIEQYKNKIEWLPNTLQ